MSKPVFDMLDSSCTRFYTMQGKALVSLAAQYSAVHLAVLLAKSISFMHLDP